MYSIPQKHPCPGTIPQEPSSERETKRTCTENGIVPRRASIAHQGTNNGQSAELSSRPSRGEETFDLANRVSLLENTPLASSQSFPSTTRLFSYPTVPKVSNPYLGHHPSTSPQNVQSSASIFQFLQPDPSIAQTHSFMNEEWYASYWDASSKLELDPGNFKALIIKLKALQYIGSRSECEETALALINRANVLRNEGRWADSLEAVNGFLSAIQENSSAQSKTSFMSFAQSRKPFMLFCKADVLRNLGLAAESLQIAEECLDILLNQYFNPAAYSFISKVMICKSKALLDLHQYPECLNAANNALYLFPNNKLALDCKASALLGLHDYKRCLEVVNALLEMDPNHTRGLLLKASALIGLGDWNQTLYTSDQILVNDPNNIMALVFKAAALRHLGQFVESLIAVAKALEIQPNNPRAIACKADTLIDFTYFLIKDKSYDNALRSIEESFALRPYSLPICGQKLYVLKAMGQLPAAVEVCKQAIAICEAMQKASKGSIEKTLFIQGLFTDAMEELQKMRINREPNPLEQLVEESNDYMDAFLRLPK